MFRHAIVGQKGFNLIEITISSMLIAVSLLAALSMQNIATRDAVEARQTTHANMLAMDMLERIQMNSYWLTISDDNAQAYQVAGIVSKTDLTEPSCADSSGFLNDCTGDDIKAHDLYHWRTLLLGLALDSLNQPTATLPEIEGCIGVDNDNGEVVVVVRWTGQYERGDSALASNASTLGVTPFRQQVAQSCGKSDSYRRMAVVSTLLS